MSKLALLPTTPVIPFHSQSIIELYPVILNYLLMREEHSETKAKTETRYCETKTEIETQTKKLL